MSIEISDVSRLSSRSDAPCAVPGSGFFLRSMRRHLLPAAKIAVLVLLTAPVQAKPPLPDSQQSPASTCIAFKTSYLRLVDICREALAAPGASHSQRIDMLDSLGWALYGLDRDDEARATFERILTLDPASDDGHAGLGWLSYDEEDYTTAARHFEAALARSPNARVLAGLSASRFYATEIDADAAVELLDAALAIDPDYQWALRRKGWILVDAEEWKPAETAFRAAIKQDPSDANAQYGLAYLLSEQDRWKEALGPINRAVEEEPESAHALSRRSLIHYYLDHPKMALKDAEAVIELRPDWSEGFVRKARALDALGQRQEALALLAGADSRIANDDFLIYWRASLLLDDGQLEPAMEQIARNADGPDADFHDYLLQARIALQLEDQIVARSAIDSALSLRPKDRWALFYDAQVLVAEQSFFSAEASFDAAVSAGLAKSNLPEFLQALIGKGQLVQAIRMRARYALTP